MSWSGLPRAAALAVALLASLVGTAKADPPSTPLLRVESGTHLAVVNRLVGLSGDRFLSASDDQTVRVWAAAGGEPVAVVRGPAGPTDEGAVYALATGGRFVATAGRAGRAWGTGKAAVRILDAESLAPLGLLAGLPSAVLSLAFSPDGKMLAVGMLGERQGVRVYELGQGAAVVLDRDYREDAADLAFTPGGDLVVADGGGALHVYPRVVGTRRSIPLPAGARPWRVAVSPADPDLVAIGVRDMPAVLLVKLSTGDVQTLGVQGLTRGELPVVAWSADGKMVQAAGRLSDADPDFGVHGWMASGRYVGAKVRTGRTTLTALAALPDGGVLVGDASGGIRRFAADGSARFDRSANAPRLRGSALRPLAVSADGQVVEFALDEQGTSAAAFDVANRTLRQVAPGAKGGAQPRERKVKGLSAAVDPATGKAAAAGRPLPLDADERALDAAVAGDGQTVYVVTNFNIRAYRDGQLTWKQPTPAPAWGVAPSADGRHLVVARGDGILQWLDTRDGSTRASLFATRDLRHWVMWTPEGYFDHSQARENGKGGADLVGYHINNGDKDAATFLAIDRLYREYYRSDLVTAALGGASPGKKPVGDQPDIQDVLRQARPPNLSILEVCGVDAVAGATGCVSPKAATGTRGSAPLLTTLERHDTVEIVVRAKSNGAGIGRLEVRRNGASLAAEGEAIGGQDTNIVKRRISLTPGENRIEVVAFDSSDRIASEPATVVLEGPLPLEDRRVVRTLAVGISDYAVNSFDLEQGVATRDAEMVASLFRQASSRGKVFTRWEGQTLLDSAATAQAIDAALDRLAKEAGPTDTVVVFFSGHGDVVDRQYHFAPHDMGTRNTAMIADAVRRQAFSDVVVREVYRQEGYSQERLLQRLRRIQAERVIIILDTCYSGAFAATGGAQLGATAQQVADILARESGRFVLGSARGLANDTDGKDDAQSSGHGLFSSALRDALTGAADTNQDRLVSLVEVGGFLKVEIKNRSATMDVQQTPVANFFGNPYFDLVDVPTNP